MQCAVIERKSPIQRSSFNWTGLQLITCLSRIQVVLSKFSNHSPILDLFPQGGKHFFTAIKEGDELKFATEDENERHLWVQALYRATGQAYKPVPPKQSSVNQSKAQGFADKASKHGLDDFIQADPVINHDHLFMRLQALTLDYRLVEPICSLGWFSPGQVSIGF